MAKPTTIKIRLNSTAGTGHFYVTKKNARTMTEKMTVRKYDPVVRKHVEYKEGKIKYTFVGLPVSVICGAQIYKNSVRALARQGFLVLFRRDRLSCRDAELLLFQSCLRALVRRGLTCNAGQKLA